MTTQDAAALIRARVSLVDVVSETVALRRVGRELVGRCPFHADRTPSFYVSPEKGLYYCFGCRAGGDVVDYVMRRDQLSFSEALAVLARRAGVALPRDRAEGRDLQAVTAALEDAARFYEEALAGQEGRVARSYLEERGVSPDTAAAFRLGYAPDAWQGVTAHLLAQGYAPRHLLQAGVAARGHDGRLYDRFRRRLMFPIRDAAGRVIAFGGRALPGAPSGTPKYLNSPEGPLFQKGRTWYDWYLAREPLRARQRAVLVEGYLDVVTAHQAGVPEALASLGTSLTEQQVQALARVVEEVVLAYDADAAGEQAAKRGWSLLEEAGLRVRVAVLPAGKDPDELVRAKGAQALIEALEGAVPVGEFALKQVLARVDVRAPEGKARAAREVLPVIFGLTSPLEQDRYLRQLARALGVDEGSLRREAERMRLPAGRIRSQHIPAKSWQSNRNAAASVASPGAEALRQLLILLLKMPELIPDIRQRLDISVLGEDVGGRLAKILLEGGLNALEATDDPAVRQLAAELVFAPVSFAEPEDAARSLVEVISYAPRCERWRELARHVLQGDASPEEVREYLELVREIPSHVRRAYDPQLAHTLEQPEMREMRGSRLRGHTGDRKEGER